MVEAVPALIWAVGPSRPPDLRTDGDGRGDELHDHDARADAGGVVVDRVDGGVGAVALGLGGEGEHQQAGEEAAEEPTTSGTAPVGREVGGRCAAALTIRSRRCVAAQVDQQQPRAGVQRPHEHQRADACRDADERRQGEGTGVSAVPMDAPAPSAGRPSGRGAVSPTAGSTTSARRRARDRDRPGGALDRERHRREVARRHLDEGEHHSRAGGGGAVALVLHPHGGPSSRSGRW